MTHTELISLMKNNEAVVMLTFDSGTWWLLRDRRSGWRLTWCYTLVPINRPVEIKNFNNVDAACVYAKKELCLTEDNEHNAPSFY